MMDGKSIRNKLIGSDDERAVSPVIGVILMVAITVILAAVIAAFVLDMGQSQSQPVQAAVNADVSNTDGEVQITITDAGNAESFEVRGDSDLFESDSESALDEGETGYSETIGNDSDIHLTDDASGELTVVGINGDEETTVTTFTVDFPGTGGS